MVATLEKRPPSSQKCSNKQRRHRLSNEEQRSFPLARGPRGPGAQWSASAATADEAEYSCPSFRVEIILPLFIAIYILSTLFRFRAQGLNAFLTHERKSFSSDFSLPV